MSVNKGKRLCMFIVKTITIAYTLILGQLLSWQLSHPLVASMTTRPGNHTIGMLFFEYLYD